MVQSQFSLCWDSYKSSVCSGFSTLQQNGEFVDMTLAADGHFVKVHQMLVALASPYLKDLITSAPCQHPVVFLNNVSHKTLCLLLEYIYTGEVLVRADHLSAFAEAAKSLHIKGLENISGNESSKPIQGTTLDDNTIRKKTTLKSLIVPTTESSDQINIPHSAKRIYIKREKASSVPSIKPDSIVSMAGKEEMHDYTEMLDDSSAAEDNESFIHDHGTHRSSVETDGNDSKGTNLQFTVSIRGSLQMILNRYIYNLNSTTSRTGVRRWRCVDYRNNKCTAFVITRGNVVVKRANLHNHAFHDKKILAKMQKKAVFSALDDIESYRDREQKRSGDDADDMSMDQDNFLIDDFETEMDVKTSVLLDKES